MNLPLLAPSVHEFADEEFGTKSKLLAEFGRGDDPIAVVLTCWELAGAPDQLSRAGSGEIMVVQNPGGLVPAAEKPMDDSGALNSVMYALSCPSVRHVIACGHTDCATLKLIARQQRQENPFQNPIQAVATRLNATYADRPEEEWLGILVQEVILLQLANLRSHAEIEGRLQQGNLHLHGWIRDDRSSVISAYDPESGQFS